MRPLIIIIKPAAQNAKAMPPPIILRLFRFKVPTKIINAETANGEMKTYFIHVGRAPTFAVGELNPEDFICATDIV